MIFSVKMRILFTAVGICIFSVALFAQGRLRLPPIKIGPLKAGETLAVRAFGPRPLNVGSFNVWTSLRIGDDGKMNLPFVGEVQAAGLTVPELQRIVESR